MVEPKIGTEFKVNDSPVVYTITGPTLMNHWDTVNRWTLQTDRGLVHMTSRDVMHSMKEPAMKAEYVRTADSFGETYRGKVAPGVEVGACRRRKETTWEAFASFGQEGLNKTGFKDEKEALQAAEQWVLGKVEEARNGITQLMLSRA